MFILEEVLIAYIVLYVCILGFKPKKLRNKGNVTKILGKIQDSRWMLTLAIFVCIGVAVNTIFIISDRAYTPYVIVFAMLIIALIFISFWGETQIIASVALCLTVFGLIAGIGVKAYNNRLQAEEQKKKEANPIELEVYARKQGDTRWGKNIFVKENDVVEFKIVFVNQLDKQVDNVMIRSVLSDELVYLENSTDLYNSFYQNGVRIDNNTVTTSGINIGSYSTRGNAEVYFFARAELKENNPNELKLLSAMASATVWTSEYESDALVQTDGVAVSVIP